MSETLERVTSSDDEEDEDRVILDKMFIQELLLEEEDEDENKKTHKTRWLKPKKNFPSGIRSRVEKMREIEEKLVKTDGGAFINEMRKSRSLVGLNKQENANNEEIWNSLINNDPLSGLKTCDNSDVSLDNILADGLSSSDVSPSLSRTMKFWKSFKKRTSRKFRSRWKPNLTDETLCNREGGGGDSSLPVFPYRREDSEDAVRSSEGEDGQDGSTDALTQKVSKVDTKLSMFRSLPFFALNVVLKEGKDLVAKDICGTSDPYVRFMIGGKQFFKSRTIFRNLSPKWDERFTIPIEDPFQPIQIEVFDYDRGLSDDPMGWTTIHPTKLDLNAPTELKLILAEKKQKSRKKNTTTTTTTTGVSNNNMGYLVINCTLIPKSQLDKEEYTGKMLKFAEHCKKVKIQPWNSIVTILLIDGRDLLSMDDNGFSDPYVKFRLGNERYKSRYKAKTLNPKWLEQFDLYMFDDQTSFLEITVMDHDHGGRDDTMGRAAIDLSQLERDRTHSLNLELEDGSGNIHILLTISAIASYQCSTESDGGIVTSSTTTAITATTTITSTTSSFKAKLKRVASNNYGLFQSMKNVHDVGCLQVKVIKARGLAAGDIGGKSDPFCVLELVNSRVQTHTEYKTLAPNWSKTFTLNVKDIHSILEVLIYDEDPDKKSDFLGKVAIPLLKIKNGQKKWYQLKDEKLTGKMKGAIKLEMSLVFNHFKAAVRTFNPKEEKYLIPEPRFRVSVMKHNIDRVLKVVNAAIDVGKFIQTCFDWENKLRSILVFLIFLVIVWNFELYLLPLTLLLVFLKNLIFTRVEENILKDKSQDKYINEDEEEIDEEKENKKEEKKSFKEKLQAIQDVCLQVQEIMDKIASMGERVKNSMNWTIPWLTWLAIIALTIATVVLYFIPLRYLVLLWGINKFTKKLRAPNSIPNNELIDYLSRIPADKELVMYREFRPDSISNARKKKQ